MCSHHIWKKKKTEQDKHNDKTESQQNILIKTETYALNSWTALLKNANSMVLLSFNFYPVIWDSCGGGGGEGAVWCAIRNGVSYAVCWCFVYTFPVHWTDISVYGWDLLCFIIA